MITFKLTDTLGNIVTQLPRAGEIFKAYHIDYCCGGDRSLADALDEAGVDREEVLVKLEAMAIATEEIDYLIDFDGLTAVALIEYIENTHHAYLKDILPKTQELVAKIMEVHGLNHKELYEVHRLFGNLKVEIEQHLVREEKRLFPVIKDYGYHKTKDLYYKALNLLKDIEAEHDAAGTLLKALRRVTNDYRLPEDACPTYVETFNNLVAIEEDLFQHIHLENNILFKKVQLRVYEEPKMA